METPVIHESEKVLEDKYPVFVGYVYLCDGVVTVSPLTGSVGQLKRERNATEIRRCDLVKRRIFK